MRSCSVALASLVCLACLPQTLRAQDATAIPQSVVATSTPLSDAQTQTLESYVSHHLAALAGDDPAAIAQARSELAQPPGRPGASPVFQRAYSSILLPRLAEQVDGAEPFRAVNALIVVRALRTGEAVEFLLERTDTRSEPRESVRLLAMSLVGETIADAGMTPAQIDGAVRRIAASADRETNWVAIFQAIDALASIAATRELPATSVSLALQAQVDVLRSAVKRVGRASTATPLMNAVMRGLIVVRDQLVVMSPSAAADFRVKLAPVLGEINAVARAQWDSAQDDPSLRGVYGDAVSNSELLLKLIDPSVRSDLRTAWQNLDKPAFDRDVAAWQAVLSRPPYTG